MAAAATDGYPGEHAIASASASEQSSPATAPIDSPSLSFSSSPATSFQAAEPSSPQAGRPTVESSQTLPSGRHWLRAGWMRKQSKYLGSWRKRWMALRANVLESFKMEAATGKPTESIMLADIIHAQLDHLTGEPHVVRVRLPDERELLLAADSEDDASAWAVHIDMAASAARRRVEAQRAFAAARSFADMEVAMAEARAAGTSERILQGFATKLEQRRSQRKHLRAVVEERPEDLTASLLSGVPQALAGHGYVYSHRELGSSARPDASSRPAHTSQERDSSPDFDIGSPGSPSALRPRSCSASSEERHFDLREPRSRGQSTISDPVSSGDPSPSSAGQRPKSPKSASCGGAPTGTLQPVESPIPPEASTLPLEGSLSGKDCPDLAIERGEEAEAADAIKSTIPA